MRHVILLLLFTMPAYAQEVKIDRATCKYLTRHIPDDDVNYKPGKDARGRAVKPADLNAPVEIGEVFTIPITIELGEKYGLGKAKGTEATIGIVTVDSNKAYLNGQPLTSEDEENLAVLCLEASAKRQ